MYKLAGKKSAAFNTCWRNFSRYIRLRDALATTGTTEYARCITCGVVSDISDMDAGHMIPGRTNGILFDYEIVHAQCRACNREGGGEKQAYRMVMVAKYGQDWYDMKLAARKKPTKLTDFDLEQLNKVYLAKIRDLREIDKD